tara:strand:- start:255 stop:626 length:372 start_codon:yes stop_codon:yes gene_type:complete
MAQLNKESIKQILIDMDDRLKHIEDITADNRSIIVKLVKQSNQIVEFLKDLEIETVNGDFEDIGIYEDGNRWNVDIDKDRLKKYESVKELVSEFMERAEELKEFEEELKKHKDKLTPGQVGES